MKIAIGSDKSGFNAKEAIKAYLTEAGIESFDRRYEEAFGGKGGA